ncbi:hypothetical protein L4C39_01010 [Vibrio clamense]|uniref:hypothetical protein n=1 Tax=Vibrio clamense TaxID=2910254 RepID=UPI003D1ABE23
MKLTIYLSLTLILITSTMGCTSTRYSSRLLVAPPTKHINLAPTLYNVAKVTKALTPIALRLMQPIVVAPKIIITK